LLLVSISLNCEEVNEAISEESNILSEDEIEEMQKSNDPQQQINHNNSCQNLANPCSVKDIFGVVNYE
jgi:hypothetical protein